MTLTPGTRLGPYEVVEPLGAGGMGEVYRARDPRLEREVAIKVLRSEKSADPARLRRFEREARAVAALNHPHILTVFDVGIDGDTPYVVTELLEGETLRAVLSRRAPTQRQLVSFAVQIAQGLAAAHQKGVVHRDLKPENLFVTTEGRVKILDFGLAKLVEVSESPGATETTADASTPSGVVMGTVSYMSPEQVRALPLDHRTDIFSFGVVLYEVLGGRHPFRRETGPATLEAIVHEAPPDLGSLGRGVSPALSRIVGRCLEKQREDRFHSAHDLALALESVLQTPSGPARLDEMEERSPYPGLRSFTEKDAGVFFGREAEVGALWERIRERRLLAMIGPSGAGKTSFVRAGVVPSRPDGWVALVCTPGTQPFRGLGRVLGPELSGDSEGLGMLVDVEDPDTAVALVSRWRRREAEALLVVDQAEELFTLNPPEVQERFATLLGRLTDEAEVHVVLSLRDDFLVRCSGLAPFEPVLRDLTALQPLESESLRRALVEPASKRGYRFEDEALVDEMVQAVEGARGALPLLAFAVSRLWEKRDRERKLLTRSAHEEIGGVAGALAQHAEQTLERIGSSREPLVREIFRNLVTAQGTRAVGDREELLSLFPERGVAEEVLQQLVDARLLTSYEFKNTLRHPEGARLDDRPKDLADDSSRGTSALTSERHRIEIVHESLLSAWPRLVRWQAQDEEGAVLRDQLRQAAHLWDERSRDPDLLWSGTAYREYELWRERYPGQLTAVEQDFSRAMVDQVRRQRRIRRGAVAAAFLLLAGVAGAVAVSRATALRAARGAEAARVAALGRNELDRYPAAALAYARRSLEIADTPVARRLALEALWRSPPARIVNLGHGGSWGGAFSPTADRFAAYTFSESVLVFHDDGSAPRILDGFPSLLGPPAIWFTPTGSALITFDNYRTRLRAVSLPGAREISSYRVDPLGDHARGALPAAGPEGILSGVVRESDGIVRVVEWPYDGGPPRVLGSFPSAYAVFDIPRRRMALAREGRICLRPIEGDGIALERSIGRVKAEDPFPWIHSFSPDGKWIAVEEQNGQLRLWSPASGPSPRAFEVDSPEGQFVAAFAPDSRTLVWASSAGRGVSMWDLQGPPDAGPMVLRRSDVELNKQASFDPDGRWLAVMSNQTTGFWPRRWPRVYPLRGHESKVFSIAFSPDSRWLLSAGADGALAWPLEPEVAPGRRHVPLQGWGYGLAFTPDGHELLECFTGAYLQPLDGDTGRWLLAPQMDADGNSESLVGCAIDPSGRWAAVSPEMVRPPQKKWLRVLDLESGQMIRKWPLAPEGEEDAGYAWGVWALAFSGDRILGAGAGGVRWFDLRTGGSEWMLRAAHADLALSGDARHLVVAAGGDPSTTGDDQQHVGFMGRTPSRLVVFDLVGGDETPITSHGSGIRCVAIDGSGEIIATGDVDGGVRVGLADGTEPHLLLGHSGDVTRVAVSPDGRWVASLAGSELLLWPVPDVNTPPLHALPHDDLVTRLRSMTNLDVVSDSSSATGYRLELGPFPGWRDVPKW